MEDAPGSGVILSCPLVPVLMRFFGCIYQFIFVAQIALSCLDDPGHGLPDVGRQHAQEATKNDEYYGGDNQTTTAGITGRQLRVSASMHPTLELLDHDSTFLR